jgi:hypothetical protein
VNGIQPEFGFGTTATCEKSTPKGEKKNESNEFIIQSVCSTKGKTEDKRRGGESAGKNHAPERRGERKVLVRCITAGKKKNKR